MALSLPIVFGLGAMGVVAGILGALVGIGGGIILVPTLVLLFGYDIKIAVATSNFMIGMTAISSLFVYFARGYVHPLVAAPAAIGIVCGATAGTSIAHRVSPRVLRRALADRRRVQLPLRIGLALSFVLMLAGIIIKFSGGQHEATAVKMFSIFGTGLSLGDQVMALGILVLAATPALRVLTLLILWIEEKGRRFAGVAAVVLVVLGIAIALGGG